MKLKQIEVGYKGSLNYNSAEVRVTYQIPESEQKEIVYQEFLQELKDAVEDFLQNGKAKKKVTF